MVAQKTLQIRKMVGMHTGSRKMTLGRVMLGLALCVLIGGMAPTAAAWRGNDSTAPQRLYDRQANGIWFSDDAGLSWSQAGALPSRPLALAVAERSSSPGTPAPVFVGTESRGLLRSDDGGVSWQPAIRDRFDSAALSRGNAAPLAVTALAIDPEDEQIIYAATNIWLGTSTVHLTPLGVAVSVDGGRQWLQLSNALLSDTPVWHLEPVAGQPLSVVTVNNTGSYTVSLKMSPVLLGLLQDDDPAVRASAARAVGLIGDPAALPSLMQALTDPDALAGQRVGEAIGRIGDRSVSAGLLKVLGSAPAAERTRAALALGLLKSGESVPGLAALLNAGDPEAQRVAAEALAAIGTPSAMRALVAPLADQQMTSALHAAMGGLELVGQPAVALLAEALYDPSAVVRANAAEMLGWLKPASAVADLARLLSDPNPAVQAQAAWALGEVGTEPARLALIRASVAATNPAPVLALNPAPVPPASKLAPILVPTAARPVALAPLAPAPLAPLAALPGALADIPANFWSLTAMALLVLAMLAGMFIWKGPRSTSHHGHA